jgi:enamine deaminase RidA (YjgF/YER057c/UK114 family)
MGTAQSDRKKILVNPPGTEQIYSTWQFSQAVRVGDTVWVSGQVGVDETMTPGEGIEAQARLAFKNLEAALTEAGGSLADVVEIVTFHTSMQDVAGFAKVKSEFIPENYPAWTAVGVKATAVIGSGSGG